MKPIILMDVDGVKADFITGSLPFINRLTGTNYAHEDVTRWEMGEALNLTPDQSKELKRYWASPGFCRNLPAYEGAIEGVAKLREYGVVLAITAALDSDTWMREREQWLVENFRFDRNDVMHVDKRWKHLVRGRILVEDRTDTLCDWQKQNPFGTGILMGQPYNHIDVASGVWRGAVAHSWDQLVSFVKRELRYAEFSRNPHATD